MQLFLTFSKNRKIFRKCVHLKRYRISINKLSLKSKFKLKTITFVRICTVLVTLSNIF